MRFVCSTAMETDGCNGASSQGLEGELLQPIRSLLLESLSHESQGKVKEIVKDVEQLSKLERLMLYIDLPSSQHASDPLRQPINPLGSRSEIQLTITWIRTHLEEDPQVSLPKHEVYDEYMEYCNENSLKALSTADFGKVMKQVYPQVRPRRLGTRGNSRYCYAGLRKKVKLEEPCTPECIVENNDKSFQSQNSRVDDAATFLLLEWVEKLFNERIKSVKDLGLFLIEKMYVDNRSSAAHTLLSSIKMRDESMDMKEEMDNKDGNMQFDESDSVKRKKMVNVSSIGFDMELCDTKRKRLEPMNHDNIEDKLNYTGTSVTLEPKVQMNNSCLKIEKNNDHSPLQQLFEKKGNLVSSKKDWENGNSCNSNDKQLQQQQADHNIEDEITSYFGDNSLETDDVGKSDKLSQLRQLLEKNLTPTPTSSINSAFRPASLDADPKLVRAPWTNYSADTSPIAGAGGNSNGNNGNGNSLCQRRRVSFNPLVVQETGNAVNVQPSPGTRKRHFSFQPISPRQASLPQSPNASPFISPRSTPVPMLRSRHSSGSALPLHLLPQGGGLKNPFGSSSASDTSRAATFGSTSECSTPFISPHGTPIPFNRSRHNSAQGRLCRSRHSSGLGPYRYNMTFSPMALNNLNNPYSPQPSTPITSQEDSLCAALLNDHHHHQQQQRSRHSSAESEPPMRTILMSPTGMDKAFGGGLGDLGRQRHASAGQASTAFINRDSWCSLMDNEKLLGDMKPSSDAMDALKEDERAFDAHQLMDASSFHDGGGGGQMFLEKKENMQDDLDIALSALKDCDNEFSKFVQETENGK